MSQAADVSYSCGSCGYPLNLTSNRITTGIGAEYQKSIKKGRISFHSVDHSRFTQVDEAMDLETHLLCGFDSPKANATSPGCKKFTIKIRALQPSEECHQD